MSGKKIAGVSEIICFITINLLKLLFFDRKIMTLLKNIHNVSSDFLHQRVFSWMSFTVLNCFLPGADTKSEAGYTGPSSYSSDLIESLNQGELIYPEICLLELNLLLAGNPSLDVLAHVFESFLKIIRQKEKNASLLMHQVE